MNAPEKIFLPDVQATPDLRQLAIQQVGVRDVRAPIAVLTEHGAVLQSIAKWTMTVTLPGAVKGTHMSRFIELLEHPRAPLDLEGFSVMLMEMLDRLDAEAGRIEARFPYFVRKTAPVSGVESLLDYDVTWRIEKVAGQRPVQHLVVNVPVTSLCPCSKEISEYGAHNQRSIITIGAALRVPIDVETLIRIAEGESSCEVYGLLKRPDEKYVTERAYDNPKFVEDLVRDIALRLMDDHRIARWKVISENFESIHNHSAYAELSGSND
jgi:GTP cyclohydrolase IB